MENFRITNTNHKNLDGIRAIGILMVIFSHFYGTFINLTLFWTSIDLLFTLSGLLITGILIETKDSPKYFKNFYIRRTLRIFPLYYLLIILFLIYIYLISSNPESFKYFTENITYFLFYSQNWYFIYYGIPASGHMNHTWSLAVDEQIYILWPLFIFLCKNENQLIKLCIITLLFSLCFRLIYIDIFSNTLRPYAFFQNTFCRMDSFASGSLLYCLMRFKKSILNKKTALILFFSTAVLVIVIGMMDGNFNSKGYYMSRFGMTLMGLNFLTCIYLSFIVKNNFLKLIIQNPVLIYVGQISYSLYVFHWFIYILLFEKFNVFLKNFLISDVGLISATFCLIITFAASAFSYKYFEYPIMRLKKKFV